MTRRIFGLILSLESKGELISIEFSESKNFFNFLLLGRKKKSINKIYLFGGWIRIVSQGGAGIVN